MGCSVAAGAQRDQVLFCIAAEAANSRRALAANPCGVAHLLHFSAHTRNRLDRVRQIVRHATSPGIAEWSANAAPRHLSFCFYATELRDQLRCVALPWFFPRNSL